MVKIFSIILDNFHRLQLFKTRLLCNFILALVIIIFKVPNIGDVSDISNIIAQVSQEAEYYVEGEKSPDVAKMNVTVNSGPTNIHTNVAWV